MADVVALDHRLEGISPRAFQHPADRAATAALASIPMFDTVIRRLIEFGYGRGLRQLYLANSVKVGPDQLGHTWAAYQRARHALDVEDEYHLYVTHAPTGQAWTVGAGTPIIVLESTLQSLLDPDEQRVVLAHELGHVLADHVLYRTALGVLLAAGRRGIPFPLSLPFGAVRAVLLEWARATELSCDRAAVLAVRDPRLVCRALMVAAAGRPSSELSLDAFLAQAMEYESWDDPHDRVRRFFAEISADHAFAVRRVSEVMRWVRGGDYDRIVGGDYPRRGDASDARQEASDAAAFYAQRFRRAFEDAGETVERFGRQVTDWLKKAAPEARPR